MKSNIELGLLAFVLAIGCGGGRAPAPPPAPYVLPSGEVKAPPAARRQSPETWRIAAGFDHACLIRDGQVYCWGNNGAGQLGDGTTQSRNVATRVVGLDDAVEIAAGRFATCAIRRGGSVLCWGGAEYGAQCAAPRCTTPAPIAGACLATRIAVGESHACATCTDGQAMCWGQNSGGELGIVDSDVTRATLLPNLRDAIDVAAGAYTTCVLRRDADALCWGRETRDDPPVSVLEGAQRSVAGTRGSTAISASDDNACVRQSDGAMRCWPWNPLLFAAPELETLVAPSGVTRISQGGSGGCALVDSGRVRCWNGLRQLREIPELADAVAVALGSGFGCAVRRSGVVSCWGRNESGVLGNGETAWFTQPVQAEGLPAALDVTIAHATCARLANGRVVCWGTEKSGHVPRAVPGLEDATRLQAAGELTCATRRNREVVCWSEPGEAPVALPGGADVIVGDGAIALAQLDGKVFYFGRTESGALARLGSIEGLNHVMRVSNEGSTDCALQQAGEVSCWQRPALPASEPLRPKLFRMPGLRPAGGIFGQCAVTLDTGEVFCWHGNGTQPTPWKFWQGNDARGAVEVAASREAMCALDVRGGLSCRGSWRWERDSARGRLELDGPPIGVQDAVAVATGEHHACAVADGGKVLCWGWNRNGALARHERWHSPVPVEVKGL